MGTNAAKRAKGRVGLDRRVASSIQYPSLRQRIFGPEVENLNFQRSQLMKGGSYDHKQCSRSGIVNLTPSIRLAGLYSRWTTPFSAGCVFILQMNRKAIEPRGRQSAFRRRYKHVWARSFYYCQRIKSVSVRAYALTDFLIRRSVQKVIDTCVE